MGAIERDELSAPLHLIIRALGVWPFRSRFLRAPLSTQNSSESKITHALARLQQFYSLFSRYRRNMTAFSSCEMLWRARTTR